LSEVLGPSATRIFFPHCNFTNCQEFLFFTTNYYKKVHFRLFCIQQVQIAMYIFEEIREIRKAVFVTKAFLLCIFHFLNIFSKTRVLNFPVLKSKVYSFIRIKIFLATLGPKSSDKKIRKMIIFQANPRLVKIVMSENHTDLQYLDLYL
jgi:hypothetical protein